MANKTKVKLQVLLQDGISFKQFENEEHLIAPVVLIVEGVHNGVYYSAKELKLSVQAWNGTPLPVTHPITFDGKGTSANTPELLEEMSVGRLFNVVFEDNSLKGEIWVNVKKANKINKKIIEKLTSTTEMLEVSTGLFTKTVSVTNKDWNGKNYKEQASDYKPDHLALLPDQIGACSVADGCGSPRLNNADAYDSTSFDTTVEVLLKDFGEDITTCQERGTTPNFYTRILKDIQGVLKEADISTNATSSDELKIKLREEIERVHRKTSNHVWAYIVRDGVYPNYVIYELDGIDIQSATWKESYKYTEKKGVVLAGDKKEVKKEVKYVPVSVEAKKPKLILQEELLMKLNAETRKKMIDDLIANEKVVFCEKARAALEKMPDEGLQQIANDATSEEKKLVVEKKTDVPATNVADGGDKKPVTLEDLQTLMTTNTEQQAANIATIVSTVLKENKETEQRGAIIAGLVASGECPISKEHLEKMDVPALLQMSQVFCPMGVVDNYSGVALANDSDAMKTLSDSIPDAPDILCADLDKKKA